jgi:hypothetical protein
LQTCFLGLQRLPALVCGSVWPNPSVKRSAQSPTDLPSTSETPPSECQASRR